MRTLALTLACCLLGLPTPTQAGDLLDLRFTAEALQAASKSFEITTEDIELSKVGGVSFADFSGASAIIIAHDDSLSFSPQDFFWAEVRLEAFQFARSVNLLMKGTGANYRLSLSPEGRISFQYYSSGAWQSLSSDTRLETFRWYHVAVAFDSAAGNLAIFINGHLAARAEGLPPFQSRQTLPLYIGGSPVSGSEAYQGLAGGIASLRLSKSRPDFAWESLQVGERAFDVP